MEENPTKIPVVVESNKNDPYLPRLETTKFLIPKDYSFFEFSMLIRGKLSLKENQSLYFFFPNGKLYQSTKTLSEIYEENKDEDGFLYCQYTFENTTG